MTPRRLAIGALAVRAFAIGALAICAQPLIAAAARSDPLLDYALRQDVALLPGDLARIDALQAARLELTRAGAPPPGRCAGSLGAARFAEIRASLSAAHEAVGDHRAAVRTARAAVDCAPRDANIRVQLANALFQAGDVQQAAAETTIGLGINPRHEALNRLQLQLDYLAERWPEVLQRTRYLVSLAPKSSETLYWEMFAAFARERSLAGGAAPRPPAALDEDDDWPQPLWRHLFEDLDAEALIAALDAEDNFGRRRGMLCEALYYSAQRRLAQRDIEGARLLLARATQMKSIDYIEHAMARAQLARMRSAD